MKNRYQALYKQLLFTLPNTTPALKTYAIVDSIRDESVKEKIPWSGLNHLDLWHEDLWEHELEVPLYLVELEEDNELTEYLLANKDKDLASYFISPYRLDVLQHYYNFFTYPEIDKEGFEKYGRKEATPKGKEWSRKAYFGFYDATVLADYIQTLYTEEKIDEFFAGVAMWFVPSSTQESELYIAFRDKEGQVDDVNLDLNQLLEVEAPMLNFDTVSFPTIPNLEDYAHEVTLDLKQMELFEQRHRRKFIDNVFFWAKRDGWAFYGEENANKQKAMMMFDEANALGIETESAVYRYIVCGLSLDKPLKETALYDELRALHTPEQKEKQLQNQLWKILQYQRRVRG
ncbi:hypothetical protein MNB_SV-8-178 [hydrothermal vent metagenome]|uniref:DUF4123 domain-containing protein n=1 Tax=hydrothermal vent metagenome TaxID=652676 RepID=A0A1W1CAW7_9ZZZZ